MRMGPHDRLFRHTFSVPEHAAAALRRALPDSVSRLIDWSTLRLEPGSFVDAALAGRESDLLFSARTAEGEALLYLLFEHQSEPHRWMPLRLAGYILRIWEGLRAREPGRQTLPPVIPVVLHHGEGGWSVARSLADLVEGDPALVERTLGLRIEVDDLAREPPARLAARALPPLVKLVLGMLRDARQMSLEALLARWAWAMLEVARQGGPGALEVVVRYLSEVRRIDDPAVWRDVIRRQVGAALEEVVVGLFENLEAKGRAEGEAKGKAEGRAEVVLKLLTLKFGPLAPETVARVRDASVEELDRIAERILFATALADVLG
jgi:hypothetical protein